MKSPFRPAFTVGLAALWALSAACASGGNTPAQAMGSSPPPPATYKPPSAADVNFMTGMIPHHAQAIVMCAMAASHGARADVRILCERITVGQRDEIAIMQTWLSDHGLSVPDAKSTRHRMVMPNGMEHDMLMPGMMSDEEMAALDKARGPEWDRLFLIGMIKHHEGAMTMVEELFASYGAAQDDTVFKFASDVFADQGTEIDRMRQMLAAKSRF